MSEKAKSFMSFILLLFVYSHNRNEKQQILDNQLEIKKAEEQENYEGIPLFLKEQQDMKAISRDINKQLGRKVTR